MSRTKIVRWRNLHGYRISSDGPLNRTFAPYSCHGAELAEARAQKSPHRNLRISLKNVQFPLIDASKEYAQN